MLSVYCFFKDEADVLPLTVPTWAPVADELVLIDTGSSDGSLDLAVQLAQEANPWAGIIAGQLPWPSPLDWAAITNEVADLCTETWVLRVDADEPLVGDPARFRDLIAGLEAAGPVKHVARGLCLSVFEPLTVENEHVTSWKNVCSRSRCHRWPDGWRYRYRIDPIPFPAREEDGDVLMVVQPNVAATLHLRHSWRPESLARAAGVLELAERLDGPLDAAARAHYQNAIDRAIQYAPK